MDEIVSALAILHPGGVTFKNLFKGVDTNDPMALLHAMKEAGWQSVSHDGVYRGHPYRTWTFVPPTIENF